MSSDGVRMANAGEVLDAAASTATSTQASDAQQHPATQSALASDGEQHPAAGSALASDAQQHPTTTAPAQEAAPPEPEHRFLDLRGEDAAGSFLSAAVKSAEDAIAGEYEMRARLLEARCEEAAAAVRAAEQDTSLLIDELAELRIITEEMIPELNCEDLEEQNQRLREKLEATTKQIEWKTERIARLQELEKDNRPTQSALEVNTLDMTGGEKKMPVLHEMEKSTILEMKTDVRIRSYQKEIRDGNVKCALKRAWYVECLILDLLIMDNICLERQYQRVIALLYKPKHGALEINTSELGGGECKVADYALMLHENHKQEMEAIHAKLFQLERQLEHRDKSLVLIARQLNMKLQAGEKLPEEDHQHLYAVMTHVRNILDEEVKRMSDSLHRLNREQPNKKELQENRQELIQGFENMPISGGAVFGIKRMGQLDESPFRAACNLKYRDNDPEGKAARLVSYWQEEIQKPSWHPFVTIQVNEEDKEVIDDNDPKLSKLRFQYGDSVCNAVKDALRELNEYSPRERRIMNEVWNFWERRRATIAEAITYPLEQLAVEDTGLRGHELKVPHKKCSNSI